MSHSSATLRVPCGGDPQHYSCGEGCAVFAVTLARNRCACEDAPAAFVGDVTDRSTLSTTTSERVAVPRLLRCRQAR